jgi:hypothetical protein
MAKCNFTNCEDIAVFIRNRRYFCSIHFRKLQERKISRRKAHEKAIKKTANS